LDVSWSERTSWTDADQADFFAHLQRARRANRADYLIRQASALAGSAWPRGERIALELLTLAENHGVSDFSRSGFHQLRAQCLLRAGLIVPAVEQYRLGFAAQRRLPNIRRGLHVDFAWRIATARLTEYYEEAMAALEEFNDPNDLVWPLNQYRYFGALALISDSFGDRDGARRWATNALEAASRDASPFPRHAHLGLVQTPESAAYNELLRLAAA
jgi:tetratricopeptide (TPR) repeat protein